MHYTLLSLKSPATRRSDGFSAMLVHSDEAKPRFLAGGLWCVKKGQSRGFNSAILSSRDLYTIFEVGYYQI